MSAETSEWLNRHVLVGFTESRGTAWHYRRSAQGAEPNHYPGAIPVDDVRRRLFDWVPEEVEVVADHDRFGPLPLRKHKAIVRSDTREVLGIVGAGYRVHPYDAWLVDRVTELVGSDSGIGSAGLLDRGARAWVQVEVPETFDTPAGVRFRPFLTAATALDGSMATTYLAGAQVVVCDNTLEAALRERDTARLRVPHSSRSQLTVVDARRALDLLEVTKASFQAQVETLCRIPVSDRAWSDFVRAHLPLRDETSYRTHPQLTRRAQLRHLWTSDERVAPWRGTAYGVVAAVNTFEHHVAKGARGRSRAERNARRVLERDFAKVDAGALATLRGVQDDTRAAQALDPFAPAVRGKS